jgi:predicted secreted protein with PEFG-CTERM motif
MKTQLMIFVLFGILITSVGSTPVFGENESIIVTTDKSSYLEGETISISGEIKYIALGNQLSIVIQAPNGNLVSVDQITVNSDNQFSTEIKLGGKLMKEEGTYTIKVTQDKKNHVTTSFEFGGVSSSNELEELSIIDSTVTATTIAVQDSTDLIHYEITNGKVISIIPDMDAKSLLINIEAWDDGSITLTIPRSILDAKINDGDGDTEFFVLVDGEKVDFEEITTSTDRTLIIPFSEGSEQIEIIGTFVIPEFGTIAAMILAVAIISIIAISAKSRLSIVPRY